MNHYEAALAAIQNLNGEQLRRLNREVIEAMKRCDRKATRNFEIGDRVAFTARGRAFTGTVKAVNIKTVTVATDGQFGQIWRVGAAVLTPVLDVTNAVAPFMAVTK